MKIMKMCGVGMLCLALLIPACGDDNPAEPPKPKAPAPTLANVIGATGSEYGGMEVDLIGTGFVANGAGTNTVTIGGAAATDVSVLNDTLIICTSPPGTFGLADVVVKNKNGTAKVTDGYKYFSTILAADGGGNPAPDWNLWAIDAETGNSYLIGPIGYGVTAMDFHPTTGVLYGATAPGGNAGPRELITINPATGAGTLVDTLRLSNGSFQIIPDLSFVGPVAYAQNGPGYQLVTIDHTSGVVTVVGPANVAAPACAFAADATGANVLYMTNDRSPIFSVNVATSTFTPGPTLNGVSLNNGRMNAAAFHRGVLYGLDTEGGGGASTPRQLVTINPVTGLMTAVGGTQTSGYLAAIASSTR